ncbi:MAG: GAF domain-containing protein [Actinobacteria bacterium]|jgi:hypothetical protein|nr:MAG: GAF domain-containing protein [Actinomycetota bacterium]
MTNIPDRVIRMELISYFSLYPETVATCEEMAARLGRGVEQVERQMDALVELCILTKTREGSRVLFSYLPPLSVKLASKKNGNQEVKRISPYFAVVSGNHETKGNRREKSDDEVEGEVGVRLQLMISALKMETWKECMELLLDIVYRGEGAPCGAYLLKERCSELLWDCQRGTNGTKAGMSKIAGVQNMVVEGELIKEKGLLDTSHHIKYLYPLGADEDVLICVNRNGSYHIDVSFLRSLFVDILPIVAEKRRIDLMGEVTAERLLQDSIYWSTVHSPDMSKGLLGALACVAKSVEASRVSLLVKDGSGSLRTLSTYGHRRSLLEQGRAFPVGEGVVGWCVERGDTANLTNPRVDPHFISNDYDDIDSMLCCPLIPPDGETMGAICAVNKHHDDRGSRKHFDEKDVRLFEGIAKTLASALANRNNHTKFLPRQVIQALMAAQPF